MRDGALGGGMAGCEGGGWSREAKGEALAIGQIGVENSMTRGVVAAAMAVGKDWLEE